MQDTAKRQDQKEVEIDLMKNPFGKLQDSAEVKQIVKFNRNNNLLEGGPPHEMRSRPQSTVMRTLRDEELGSLMQFKVQRFCRH